MMEHRGFVAVVEFDDSMDVLHGRAVDGGPYPVATFEATDTRMLRREFERSVDEYLRWCEEDGVEPRKPMCGEIELRLGAELHAAVETAAGVEGMSVDAWIVRALGEALERGKGSSRKRTISSVRTPSAAFRSSFQDVARNEAGPRTRPGEAWHVVSRTSRRLRCNEDAKQEPTVILAGGVRLLTKELLIFCSMSPIIVANVTNRTTQMTGSSDLGTAPRYRLEVSTTRTETVAVVIEGPLEDLPSRATSGHAPTPASTSPGLPRPSILRSHESSSKLLDRRRK